MAVCRPMPPLVLSDVEVQQLQSIANSRSLPLSIVQRAQIVLACGAGETNTAMSKRMGLRAMTVGKWRRRYRDLGLECLHDKLRSGRLRIGGRRRVERRRARRAAAAVPPAPRCLPRAARRGGVRPQEPPPHPDQRLGEIQDSPMRAGPLRVLRCP